MEVSLIRHAQTAGNLARRYVGLTDEPLCPAGRDAAAASGINPGLEIVYISPLRRAAETAAIKFPNARQLVLPNLREMDFGAFEYRTADEMAEDEAYTRWVNGGCTAPCPRGEGLEEFQARSCWGFAQAVKETIAEGRQRLVVVAHGGTVMAVMGRYARPARSYFDWAVGNCGGYRAGLDAARWPVEPRLTDPISF
ncbi:Fructose-2,6-bisphosphatase [uncultured Eubacteriales bacterium]|uniref:Fructose-2,6-bisphosphatase n=1 Tax=uncultured Eubacteriales bacterium TaxID=172733 RepID=A0A212KJB0_9FIRM|nr:Fructose-2,6-bisphosphatase [uncultured Eubacteriales bacterium]